MVLKVETAYKTDQGFGINKDVYSLRKWMTKGDKEIGRPFYLFLFHNPLYHNLWPAYAKQAGKPKTFVGLALSVFAKATTDKRAVSRPTLNLWILFFLH